MLLKEFLSIPTTELLNKSDPDRVNDPDHPNDEEGHDRGDEDIDEVRWDSELDAAQTACVAAVRMGSGQLMCWRWRGWEMVRDR